MRGSGPRTERTIDRGGVALEAEIHREGPRAIPFLPTWAIIRPGGRKAQVPDLSQHPRVIPFAPRGNGQPGRPADPEVHALGAIIDDVIAVRTRQAGRSTTDTSGSGTVPNPCAPSSPRSIPSPIPRCSLRMRRNRGWRAMARCLP